MNSLRILVDADACPVLDIIEISARKYKLELLIFFNISHNIKTNYGKLFRIDQANQSVDMALLNKCRDNDIVITGDYGLAALVLGKKAHVLNHNGTIFTDKNINQFLFKRHINAKIRRAGGKHPTASKRKDIDNMHFQDNLIKLIEQNLANN